MKSILYSKSEIGGAEVYVRILRDRFGIDFASLQGKDMFSLLRLYLAKDDYILHDLRAGIIGLFRIFRKDLIVIHGPGFSKILMNLFLLMAYVRRLDVVFVDADIARRSWVSSSTWRVLTNLSSLDAEVNEKARDFIYIGRVTASKGLNELVGVWKEYKFDATLHIVGDGDLLSDLKDKKVKNIIFHGARSHSYIEDLINLRVRYYISLSRREGFSLSLIEALSVGLIPVVVRMPSQLFIEQEIGAMLVEDDLSNVMETVITNKSNSSEIHENCLMWFKEFKSRSDFFVFWNEYTQQS